jgi:DNA-binding NarL/FixJ family response regulator
MRVLLADDHRLFAEGLRDLMAAHGFDVVGLAGNGHDAVEQGLALEPDLILMDLRMPVCDGLAATRLIKAQRPEIKIVMLTASAEDQDLFAAVQSGACGYLLKSISGKAFIEAMRGLEEGVPPFSPGLASRLLGEFARLRPAGDETRGPESAETARRDDWETGSAPRNSTGARSPRPSTPASRPTGLTERQTQVLSLVAAGLTYKEVGRELALSERTVRYHMVEMMDRLHVAHRSQVIAYAGHMGLRGDAGTR